jgi:3-methyladenine DNA glycosylase/8-oxoguanine DNA glycosylase
MTSTSLTFTYDLLLHPTPPFHFDGTVHKPSHFPSGDHAWEAGHYWQTMRFDGRIFGTRMIDQGTPEAPCIALRLYAAEEISAADANRIAEELTFRLDLQADLSAFYRDLADDALLAPVFTRWRGMRVMVDASLYEFLVIATVLQNATVRRSTRCWKRSSEHNGSCVAYDGKELYAYWPPEVLCQATEEELRALKGGYRAKQLKRQAEAFCAGALDEMHLRTLPSDALKPLLLALYGIGPASVWYLLFEVFKRYDAFEFLSPWEQKIYSRLLFDEELTDAEKILDESLPMGPLEDVGSAHALRGSLLAQAERAGPLAGGVDSLMKEFAGRKDRRTLFL